MVVVVVVAAAVVVVVAAVVVVVVGAVVRVVEVVAAVVVVQEKEGQIGREKPGLARKAITSCRMRGLTYTLHGMAETSSDSTLAILVS